MKQAVLFLLIWLVAFMSANVAAAAAKKTPPPDFQCLGVALMKRESAVISAEETLHEGLLASLQKRRASLLSAWAIENGPDRRAARAAAWETYKIEQKTARNAQSRTVKSAWKNFLSEAKACNIDAAKIEPERLDSAVSAAGAASASM